MQNLAFVSLKAIFPTNARFTFEGNMRNSIGHPIDEGTIVQTLPQPAEREYEGSAKCKKPVRLLHGAGAAREVDPDSLSFFVHLNPEARPADVHDLGNMLTAHFTQVGVPWFKAHANTRSLDGRNDVEVKLPLTNAAFQAGHQLIAALRA